MIVGLDGSKWTIVTDPAALVNTEPPVEVILWRGYDGWRDDPRFVEHRKQTVGLRTRTAACCGARICSWGTARPARAD